jgi:hypothetical protein
LQIIFFPGIPVAGVCKKKKTEVSIMFVRGDITIFDGALFEKFWLYIPRRL